MNFTTPEQPLDADIKWVLVHPRGGGGDGEVLPSSEVPRLFVRAEQLTEIFGSEKVAKILAKCCLKPTVKSNSRLTLYWIGDVLTVADRFRKGEIRIDFQAGLVTPAVEPEREA